MESVKKQKRATNAAEPVSDKKTPKSLKPKPKIVKRSVNKISVQTEEPKSSSQALPINNEQKKTTASVKNKKRATNAAVPVSEKNTPESVKPKPKIVKRSVNQISVHTEEAKSTSQAQPINKKQEKTTEAGKLESDTSEKGSGKNINWPDRNKHKKVNNEKLEERSNVDKKAEENIGGLIFMCNSKTKPDCFRYNVMGVPTNKQEIVMGIKPGVKLFLYDFDIKLLYGIYEACSEGGIKLEPAAFGGAFPVQVRFKVHKDCIPLPEGIFKKAIKDSYNEKTRKFKTELTIQQVKKLADLFRPAPSLHPNAQSSVQDSQPAPITRSPPPENRFGKEAHRKRFNRDRYTGEKGTGSLMSTHKTSPDPIFPSEKEYRNYGLRRETHFSVAPPFPNLEGHRSDRAKGQLQTNPNFISEEAMRKEAASLGPHFLSEKEYRAYGLRRELPTATTALENFQKDSYYYPYNWEADRYLPVPRTMGAPSESYSLTAKEGFVNDFAYVDSGIGNHPGSRAVYNDAERMYSEYASHALSDYNQKYHHQLGDQPKVTSTSVSSRYSFAGPSLRYP
ncbi:hypothetical protein U1Q18_020107 [Sarracenia purpurea var. burkii]